MATIKEVAKLAGVSVGSVSHVITKSVAVSDSLRKQVEAAISRLDYHPNHVARSLKTNRTRTLGIIVPDMTVSFFPQLIRGAETAARQQGYSLIASNSYESMERQTELLHLFRSQQVEGILLVVAADQNPKAQLSKLVAAGMYMVSLDRLPDRVPLDFVSVENAGAAELGAAHLIAMGYRRIAIVTGPLSLRNERRRLLGYKKALQKAGLPVRDALIWSSTLRQEDVAALCSSRLAAPSSKPDAILATNGPSGIGLLRALRNMNLKTPDDLAVVSFDELSPSDLFSPAITTIVQPAFQIGSRACEILLGRINGTIKKEGVLIESLPATLTIRDSSRRKPAAARPRNVAMHGA